jgi:threonyl-tRNA synthetase
MSEVRLTLPDGSTREYAAGVTGRQVAESIGAGLARAAVGIRVDGEIWDLNRPITADAPIAILTERDPDGLYMLRHSAAHILATAVREIFPTAGIGFGPPIEDGFYYDFEVPRPFTPEDLEKIEARMAEVAKADYQFVREEVDRGQANQRFADDPLKLERISELGDDETISVYTDGPFTDLCRGPHVPSTGRLKHFKLLTTAGAYWRGDSRRQMLQRIYGTAWFKKEDLDAYLHRLEESKKRDHRKLGRELDLFMFHHFAPGAVFWTEKGTAIYNELNAYMRELQSEGFKEIRTPLLYNKGPVGDLRALGQVPREHVPRARQRERRARLLAEADELPRRTTSSTRRRSTATATCRCGSAPTTCCTATRSRARCRG